MKNLIDELEINLNSIDIFDIDEDILIKLKEKNMNTQNKFYFYLLNRLNKLEDTQDKKAIAHCNYLMSYYLFLIFTPFLYEELAFTYARKALALDNNFKYKEWMLFFATLPNGFIKQYEAINLANEVIEKYPTHKIANMILLMF